MNLTRALALAFTAATLLSATPARAGAWQADTGFSFDFGGYAGTYTCMGCGFGQFPFGFGTPYVPPPPPLPPRPFLPLDDSGITLFEATTGSALLFLPALLALGFLGGLARHRQILVPARQRR